MGLLKNIAAAGALAGAMAVASVAEAAPRILFDVGLGTVEYGTPGVVDAGNELTHGGSGITVNDVSLVPGGATVGITGGLFTFNAGVQTTFGADGFGNNQWSFENGGSWEITGALTPAGDTTHVIARGNIDVVETTAVVGGAADERAYVFALTDVEISQELHDALITPINDPQGLWSEAIYAATTPGIPDGAPLSNDLGTFVANLLLSGVPSAAFEGYVGSQLSTDDLLLRAVPEPMTIGLLGLGLIGLGAARRRKQAA